MKGRTEFNLIHFNKFFNDNNFEVQKKIKRISFQSDCAWLYGCCFTSSLLYSLYSPLNLPFHWFQLIIENPDPNSVIKLIKPFKLMFIGWIIIRLVYIYYIWTYNMLVCKLGVCMLSVSVNAFRFNWFWILQITFAIYLNRLFCLYEYYMYKYSSGLDEIEWNSIRYWYNFAA